MKLRDWLSFHSMRTRLTLWNVGVLALVLVSLGMVFSYRVRTVALSSVDRRLTGNAHRIQDDVKQGTSPFLRRSGFGPAPPSPGGSDKSPSGDPRPRLFNLQGQPLVPVVPGTVSRSPGQDAPWDNAGFAAASQGREALSSFVLYQEPYRVLSAPLWQQGKITGVVQIARSLSQIQQDEERMTATLLTLIPLALLVAGVGGAFLTDRALRPVRQITQTAGQIEAGNLSGRLAVSGTDEFADLAETFNGMLARLERAFGDLGKTYENLEQAYEQQRRFTGDASHELRTPLTIIKANTSLALTSERTPAQYQKTLHAVDIAADRMNRIVQDLLHLARSDADQLTYPLAPTVLSEILSQAAKTMPAPQHAPIVLDVSPSLLVLGHADSLQRLFGNLLENAARHTPLDGRIAVTAKAAREKVIVNVADTGEGIAPVHLPHVMERFYRVDAARARAQGGTGLGLSICQSIVKVHGGDLHIESVLGQGTTVQVTLARAETRPASFVEEFPAMAGHR